MTGFGASLVAIAAVLLMGFAIQRGGTCMVAAVHEAVTRRRAHRLAAMLEAALWVAGGLLLVRALGWGGMAPSAQPIDRWTIAGAALLGLGAWVNGACVFGAIARLGSGQWAYLATPLGFYLGSLAVEGQVAPRAAAPASWPLDAAAWFVPAFVAFVLWRIAPGFAALRRADRWQRLAALLWSPHGATVMIGVTFLASWLLAGRWAYTDLLADLARQGMASALSLRGALFGALLASALYGGWSAGRWQPAMPRAVEWLRTIAGGALMGAGSLLIPGSNDGLLLVGLPLLQPHAWLALVVMGLVIAAMVWLGRRRIFASAAADPSS